MIRFVVLPRREGEDRAAASPRARRGAAFGSPGSAPLPRARASRRPARTRATRAPTAGTRAGRVRGRRVRDVRRANQRVGGREDAPPPSLSREPAGDRGPTGDDGERGGGVSHLAVVPAGRRIFIFFRGTTTRLFFVSRRAAPRPRRHVRARLREPRRDLLERGGVPGVVEARRPRGGVKKRSSSSPPKRRRVPGPHATRRSTRPRARRREAPRRRRNRTPGSPPRRERRRRRRRGRLSSARLGRCCVPEAGSSSPMTRRTTPSA